MPRVLGIARDLTVDAHGWAPGALALAPLLIGLALVAVDRRSDTQ
jgi:hypothetical protein